MKKRVFLLLVLSSLVLSACSGGTYQAVTEVVEQENSNTDDEFNQYLGYVPEEVLEAITSFGYTIHLVDSLDKQYNLKYVSGLTIPEIKEIWIESNAEKYRQTVVHEVFHAFDHSLGFISGSSEFIAIYDEEKELMQVTGFISAGQYKANEKEYFAEACQMYVYDANTLKQSAPKTYEYIKNLLEEVDNYGKSGSR